MHFAAVMRRNGALSAIALLALVARGRAAAEPGGFDTPPQSALTWRVVAVEAADGVVTALALDRAGRLAVGDARGVAIGFPGKPMQRVALRAAVLDLAFFAENSGGDPAVLAATALGLYRVSLDGRVESIAPGPGLEANGVARLAVADGVVAVATAAGAFIAADAKRWQRLSEELPSGPATAIALAAREHFVECWTAIRGELWRAEIRADADRLAVSTPVRVEIPFASGQRPPLDIALDAGAAAVAVVFDSELVVLEGADAGWKQLRPTLPPGASALRLVAALDRYWLATDRGLLVAADLRGPWRRVNDASGSDAIFDVETAEGALYAATENGISVARLAPDVSPAAEVSQPLFDPSEPDIHSVHRAALRYLSLDPARMAALRRGVSQRGWLPIVAVRATSDEGRSRHSDYNESFVSGEMRRFNDRDRDRSRDLELQLSVSWDLGDIAYHPEAIDVSREAREVIELRDDVLDEITQLFYERRRVLAALAQQADPPAALELKLRAAQLAAGIDAWTGGWYGSQLTNSTP